MSYLGRGVDKISNIEKLDNITFNGASSYTLQKGGVNFVPTSAAAILISIDGVVQSGNFSVSSSTIDFGTAVASTSTCNFIIHLGVGLITAPADDAVTTAKIANDAVTEAKLNLISTSSVPSLEAKGDGSSQDGYIQLNCSQNTHGIKLKSPPHSAGQSYTLTFPQSISADNFLKTDSSGNLSFAAAGGITEADQFRLTASVTGNGVITSNLERPDSSGFAKIGTGKTESGGTFSFPSTGIYQILVQADYFYSNQADNSAQLQTNVTTNNSSYAGVAWAMSGNGNQSGAISMTTYSQYFLDVTDVSQVKVKFERLSLGGTLEGDTDVNRTSFSFIRLGDT